MATLLDPAPHIKGVPRAARCFFSTPPPLLSAFPLQGGLLSADDTTGRSFVDAFFDVPIVAMSDSAEATKEAMHAVELGAVDLLSKPLSMLKLKNIWQHSVRMVRRWRGGLGWGGMGVILHPMQRAAWARPPPHQEPLVLPAPHHQPLPFTPAPTDDGHPPPPAR